MGSEIAYPKCGKCGKSELIPLSDFSDNSVSITYKAWACTNPECRGFVILRGGKVFYGVGSGEAAR